MEYRYRLYLKRKGITDLTKYSTTDDPEHFNPDDSYPIICDEWNYDIPEPTKDDLMKITDKEIQVEVKEIRKQERKKKKENLKEDRKVKLLRKIFKQLKLDIDIDIDEILDEMMVEQEDKENVAIL